MDGAARRGETGIGCKCFVMLVVCGSPMSETHLKGSQKTQHLSLIATSTTRTKPLPQTFHRQALSKNDARSPQNLVDISTHIAVIFSEFNINGKKKERRRPQIGPGSHFAKFIATFEGVNFKKIASVEISAKLNFPSSRSVH